MSTFTTVTDFSLTVLSLHYNALTDGRK